MSENKNALTIADGNITLNGAQVQCVTDFCIKTDPTNNSIASVTLTFDVYARDVAFSNQPEYRNIASHL